MMVLGVSALSQSIPRFSAEALKEQWEVHLDELPPRTNPMTDFVMRSTETRNGNVIISLGELRCRKTVPEFVWKQYRRALLEDDRHRYSESFRLATSAVTAWPGFPQAHAALALWYLRNRDLANAQLQIEAALGQNPYYLPARELLGIAFLSRGEYSNARKVLEAVVVNDPTRILAQYFLSRTLIRLREPTLAEMHLEAALRLRRHPPKPSTWSPWSFSEGE